MPGACDCNDEASKDVKCCFFLPSFMSFKILAWLNLIQMSIALLTTCAVVAMFVGIGAAAANDGAFDGMPSGMPSGMSSGVSGGAAAAGSLVAVVMVIALLMILFSLVATCMFVCCDSAKARKLYAIALVLGGLAGVGAAVGAAGKITAGSVL